MEAQDFASAPTTSLTLREALRLLDSSGSQAARLIHDGVGQSLTGVSLLTQALASDLAGRESVEAEAAMCQSIMEQIMRSVKQIRALARVCDPSEIRGPALVGAFEDLVKSMPPHRPIGFDLELEVTPVWLSDQQAFHLLRFCIDLLFWITLEGQPGATAVLLRGGREQLSLQISGSAAAALLNKTSTQTLRWQLLIERAALAGGSVKVCGAGPEDLHLQLVVTAGKDVRKESFQ